MSSPSLFVTFTPEGVEYQRRATMTYTNAGTSCELIERVGDHWTPVAVFQSNRVEPVLAKIKAWCQGH